MQTRQTHTPRINSRIYVLLNFQWPVFACTHAHCDVNVLFINVFLIDFEFFIYFFFDPLIPPLSVSTKISMIHFRSRIACRCACVFNLIITYVSLSFARVSGRTNANTSARAHTHSCTNNTRIICTIHVHHHQIIGLITDALTFCKFSY